MVFQKVVAFTVVMLPIVLTQSCLISGDQVGCRHGFGHPNPIHLVQKIFVGGFRDIINHQMNSFIFIVFYNV